MAQAGGLHHRCVFVVVAACYDSFFFFLQFSQFFEENLDHWYIILSLSFSKKEQFRETFSLTEALCW